MKVITSRISGGFYYGWIIVGVSTLSMLAQATVWLPPLSVFLPSLLRDFGWSRTQISGAVTLGTLGSGLVSVVVGKLADRQGPRGIMVVSALLLGGSLIALSLVQTLWQFYLAYSVARIVTAGPMFLAATAVVANWFILRRGRALGIVFLGGSFGMAIWPILAGLFIRLWDWRATFQIFAILVLVMLVVPSTLLLRRRPEDMGLHPDGLSQPLSTSINSAEGRQEDIDGSFTLSEALKTSAFWLINSAAIVMALGIGGVNFHQIPYLIDVGLSPEVAVTIVGIFAMVAGVSGLLWGFIVDRIPTRYALALAFALAIFGLLLLLVVRSIGIGYLYAFIYGLALGGLPIILTAVWADYFGRKNVGSIIGFSTPFQAVTLAIGPLFAGWIFDVFGGYLLAFLSFAAAYGIGGLLAFIAHPPKRKTPASAIRVSAPV